MLATAVLVADYAATLDVSDRSELRARSTQQLNTQGAAAAVTPGVDLFTQPLARMHLSDRRWDWEILDSAALYLPDLQTGVTGMTPLLSDTGTVWGAWHDRFVRLALGENATYGEQNSAYLPQNTPVPGQPLTPQGQATPTPILYASSRSYLNASARLGRQTSLALDVEYLWRGGADTGSRQVIPDQTGPLASASLDVDLGRQDRLTTVASAQRADFTNILCSQLGLSTFFKECAPQNFLAIAEERLAHKWSRTVALSLGAGGAVVTDRLSTDYAFQTLVYPVAEAAIQVHLGRPEQDVLKISARLAPYVNGVQAIVTNNLIGEASIGQALSEDVGIRGTVGIAQALPSDQPGAMSLVSGGVELVYKASRALDLGVGERAFWQQLSGFGAFISTFGFVGVTVHPPTLHL